MKTKKYLWEIKESLLISQLVYNILRMSPNGLILEETSDHNRIKKGHRFLTYLGSVMYDMQLESRKIESYIKTHFMDYG